MDASTQPDDALTTRECQIVEHLARGADGVEIAGELGITVDTLRTHLRNAMRRTGTRTRAHLVAHAAAAGAISLDSHAAESNGSTTPPAAPDPPHAVARLYLDAADATPTEMIEHVLGTACDMLRMDAAFVSETRRGVEEFVATAGADSSFGIEAGTSRPLTGTYCELLLAGRLPSVVPDSSAEPLVATLDATTTGDIGAYAGVPIVLHDGSVYGTFCCLSHEPDPLLQERDAQFMRVLARLVADLLEREAMHAAAQRLATRGEKVKVLMAALAARDGYTEEHSTAVVDLATATARRLNLSVEELEEVEGVALLHDVGKIGIPDAILGKPGKLTEEEWSVMRTHPEIGEQIVRSVPALAHLAAAIRAEHERWDGKGYPDGLAGEAIPLASRVVLVADAYHAMTSDRPYRDAMAPDDAVDELRRNAGTQFWPDAVEAAVDVLSTRHHLVDETGSSPPDGPSRGSRLR